MLLSCVMARRKEETGNMREQERARCPEGGYSPGSENIPTEQKREIGETGSQAEIRGDPKESGELCDCKRGAKWTVQQTSRQQWGHDGGKQDKEIQQVDCVANEQTGTWDKTDRTRP